MGTQFPSPKRGQSPQFSALFYCGQTDRWIKMPLRPRRPRPRWHCIRWRPCEFWRPAPPRKKGTAPSSPIFGWHLLWPNGCMYQDTTWYGRRPQPRWHCVRWGPSSTPLKGHSPPSPPPKSRPSGHLAGWIKMAPGTELGLSAGDTVLDDTYR